MSLVLIDHAIMGFANIEKKVPTPVTVDYSEISDTYTLLAGRKIVVGIGIPDWETMAFRKEKSSIDFIFCRGQRYSGGDEHLLKHAVKTNGGLGAWAWQ